MSPVAGGALLAAAWLLRGWLEASMALHMLLQLPLIAIGGALLGCTLRESRAAAALARIDAHGFTSLTWLMLASAYWMIPRALEESLTLPLAEAAKFASIALTGAVLPSALQRANAVVQLFFLGNLSWMMAVAGIQYQDMPQRLCNAYALNDQQTTGVGLVIGSIAIAVIWCLWQLPKLKEQNEAAKI
ncbi:hypothetical protein ACHMW6_13550 [Pseudoduganella sp. UC29_106]|uniref:hypothetical protein n=1 Tax=Pseudoduganella sp. UC29_106 TaxID=3374553 RepID=UPI0037575DEC